MQDSFSCRIQNHIQRNGKVLYFILIVNNKSGSIRQLKMRYSECKKLHSQLQKIISSYKLQIYLPVFPGRKMFGSTNKDESDIIQRRFDLNFYFNELLSIQKLHSLEQVKSLLLPPHIEKSTYQMVKGQYEDTSASFFTESSLADNEEDFEMNCPPSGGQIRAKIDRYSVSEDMVSYFVSFFDVSQTKYWVFRSRYSELKSLHEALSNQKKIKSLVPNFPKRKLFGITNENPEQIEKRREQLEEYLNELFMHNEVLENDVIKFYLEDTRKQAEQIKHKEETTLRKKKLRMLNNKKKHLQQQGYSSEKIQEICQEFINKDKDLKKYHTQSVQKEEAQQKEQKSDNLNILQEKSELPVSESAKPKKKNKLKYQFLERILEVNTKWESEEFLNKTPQKQQQQLQNSKINPNQNTENQKNLENSENTINSNNYINSSNNLASQNSIDRNQALKELEAQNDELEKEIQIMQRKASQTNQNCQIQDQENKESNSPQNLEQTQISQ